MSQSGMEIIVWARKSLVQWRWRLIDSVRWTWNSLLVDLFGGGFVWRADLAGDGLRYEWTYLLADLFGGELLCSGLTWWWTFMQRTYLVVNKSITQ